MDDPAQLSLVISPVTHQHLDKKESFPTAMVLGRWGGTDACHNNKGSALIWACPICSQSLTAVTYQG